MKQEEAELKIDELTGRIAVLAGNHLWVEIQNLMRAFYADASLSAYEKGIRDCIAICRSRETESDLTIEATRCRQKMESLLTKPKDKE